MQYLLLLRGINVGGKRPVAMASLVRALTDLGLRRVQSYINSGNLSFESAESQAIVQERINTYLHSAYVFEVPAVVLKRAHHQADLTEVPSWWGEDATWRHNAVFFLPSVDREALIARLATVPTTYDRIHVGRCAVYWSATQQQYAHRSFYAKMAKEPFYTHVTIRNRNTALYLARMHGVPHSD